MALLTSIVDSILLTCCQTQHQSCHTRHVTPEQSCYKTWHTSSNTIQGVRTGKFRYTMLGGGGSDRVLIKFFPGLVMRVRARNLTKIVLILQVFAEFMSEWPRGWRDGDAKHRVGRGGVRSDSEKKIVTSPKLGLFLGRKAQEACPSILL